MSLNFQRAIDEIFKPPSKIQQLTDRACAQYKTTPDLNLNMEICEYVNRKKGNLPHEAVFACLPYINSRDHHQALLALNLLDNLVKNCGHSVHYQIATRDFLNRLVRKFPEFQPPIMDPVMYRIVEMLQEWRTTLYQNSRYKEDLSKIQDMCSLLERKGWRFPNIRDGNAAVILGPQNQIKTQSEMEKEDIEAMKVKLQELLRRATPQDLREANKLMKLITGYESTPKSHDYNQEFVKELSGLETKAELLRDIILVMEPGQYLDETAQDLLSACVSNQNKVKELLEHYQEIRSEGDFDESEEHEISIIYHRLIYLTNIIPQVIKAAHDVERGIKPEFNEPESRPDLVDQNADSLIRLEDDENDVQQNGKNSNSESEPKSANILDDLLGLSFNENPKKNNPLYVNLTASPSVSPSPSAAGFFAHTNTQKSTPRPGNLSKSSSKQPSKNDPFDFGDIMSINKSFGTPNSSRSANSASSANPSTNPVSKSNVIHDSGFDTVFSNSTATPPSTNTNNPSNTASVRHKASGDLIDLL